MAAVQALPVPQPDLHPIRLRHSSYDFDDPANNIKTAMEVADTLDDHWALARDNGLSQSQLKDFAIFLDEQHVFQVAVIVIPEVAQLAGQDYWVTDDQKPKERSSQVIELLHAIVHLEPRSRRLSAAPEETEEEKSELLRRTREIAERTNADIEAHEAEAGGEAAAAETKQNGATRTTKGPTTRIEVGQMTTVGDLIRKRSDAGRISWQERQSM